MDYSLFITSSLTEAAKIATYQFGKVSGVTKGEDNNQLLTETDKEIGTLLINKIKQQFPNFNIIDEEIGVIDNHSDFTWVIDPIDGTSNFANGIPTYGIYLGLLQDDKPIAGGLALPFFQKIYTAEKGKGTFYNGQLVYVTAETNLLSSLVAYQIDGHQENPELTQQEANLLGNVILQIRNLRTTNSAFDGAMILEGRYGAILNKTSKIWDNVALHILIEEAGGVYTDFYGNPIDYSTPLEKAHQNFTFCAGAQALHQQLQEIIHRK